MSVTSVPADIKFPKFPEIDPSRSEELAFRGVLMSVTSNNKLHDELTNWNARNATGRSRSSLNHHAAKDSRPTASSARTPADPPSKQPLLSSQCLRDHLEEIP